MVFYYRITRLLFHVLVGVFIAIFVFPVCKSNWHKHIIQRWSLRLINLLNIRVLTFGLSAQPNINSNGMMLLANHISWVEIFALQSLMPLRFIAKSDIKNWPIVGLLAKKTQVLFIERQKRLDVMHMIEKTKQCLTQGEGIAFFPEGTTSDGTHLLPFRSNLIQAAIKTKAQIQPVAIYYPTREGKPNIAMAYAGQTTLAESILAILHQQAPVLELHFLPMISLKDVDENLLERRALMQYIQVCIQTKLNSL